MLFFYFLFSNDFLINMLKLQFLLLHEVKISVLRFIKRNIRESDLGGGVKR